MHGFDGLWCLTALSTIFQLYRNFIGGGNRITADCAGSCKSNYHMTTTAPLEQQKSKLL